MKVQALRVSSICLEQVGAKVQNRGFVRCQGSGASGKIAMTVKVAKTRASLGAVTSRLVAAVSASGQRRGSSESRHHGIEFTVARLSKVTGHITTRCNGREG